MMKTTNIQKTILVACLSLTTLCSCSIKEERSVCPCVVEIDYSAIKEDQRISESEDQNILLIIPSQVNMTVKPRDYPDGQELSISRKNASFNCYMGYSSGRISGSRLVIPEGSEGDQLYSYHKDMLIGPNTENVRIAPVLCSEFTKVVIRFVGNESAATGLTVRATSTTNGLDLATGHATEGDFRCELTPIDAQSFAFNMPRQKNRDIEVDIFSTDEPVYTLELWRELDRASYDWDAESLAPLVIINIDRKKVDIDVTVLDWNESITYEYIL